MTKGVTSWDWVLSMKMVANAVDSGVAWKPIADGDVAAHICEALDDITEDLGDGEYRGCGLELQYPFSLAFGASGVALFLSYLASSDMAGSEPRAAIASHARSLIEQSFTAVSDRPMLLDLFRGFTGISWVYEHVRDVLFPGTKEDTLDETGSPLASWCNSPACPAEFLEGGAGICLYASELAGSPQRGKFLSAIVKAIQQKAEFTLSGISWSVSNRIHSSITREDPLSARESVRQLGAAHGVSGILACLASAFSAGVEQDSIRDMVHSSMSWMLAQKRPNPSTEMFPMFAGLDWPHHTTGWCNGDLGLGVALFQVGQAFGQSEWTDLALEVLRREAMKRTADIEYTNRKNCTLCHGSSGRLQIFNRLFHATDDPIFAEAALFWLRATLALRVPGQGIGGFLIDEPNNGGPKKVKGFLMGAAGVGLALLATITSQPPSWDKLLLASISRN
jgi:lantibiotic modifying enzyme